MAIAAFRAIGWSASNLRQGHRIQILVLPVDADGISAEALDVKAEALLKRDCIDVALADRQFEPRHSKRERRIDPPLHQSAPDTHASKRRQKADIQCAAVRIDNPGSVRNDVATTAPLTHSLRSIMHHCSATRPFCTRKIDISSVRIDFPVGARSKNAPLCTPVPL